MNSCPIAYRSRPAPPGAGGPPNSSLIVTSVSLAFRRSTARLRLTARSGPLASARTAARMTTSRRGAPVANDPRPTTRTTTRAHAEAVFQNREKLRIQFTPPVRDVVRTARELDPGPVYPTGAQARGVLTTAGHRYRATAMAINERTRRYAV